MSKITERFVVMAVILLGLTSLAVLAGTPRVHPRGGSGFEDHQFNIRVGQFEPDGDSDLFEENVDLYGLSAGGLDDWSVGIDFGTAVSDRMEVLFGLDYYSGEDSSYRLVDTDGIPIVLANRLRITPVTVGLKFLPFGRTSDAGRYRRLVPYVGVGVGVYFWDYEEVGDFIDPGTWEVYSGRAEADGSAFGAHLFAGVEVPFSPYWSLLLEWRHQSVDDDLGGLYEGYGELDLSGDALMVGTSWRF